MQMPIAQIKEDSQVFRDPLIEEYTLNHIMVSLHLIFLDSNSKGPCIKPTYCSV